MKTKIFFLNARFLPSSASLKKITPSDGHCLRTARHKTQGDDTSLILTWICLFGAWEKVVKKSPKWWFIVYWIIGDLLPWLYVKKSPYTNKSWRSLKIHLGLYTTRDRSMGRLHIYLHIYLSMLENNLILISLSHFRTMKIKVSTWFFLLNIPYIGSMGLVVLFTYIWLNFMYKCRYIYKRPVDPMGFP